MLRLSRPAMGTRFEFLLCGEDVAYLQSAAEEALDEVERLDQQLSLFVPTSDICAINARAAGEPVRVERRLFALLERALLLSRQSEGAFDIAVLALTRLWKAGKQPDEGELAAAWACSGSRHVMLDREQSTIRFRRAGVGLDLGAIGKGYALEVAAELLWEKGITNALLHGGWSSVYALGAAPGKHCWPVAITHPLDAQRRLAVVELKDCALGISANTYQQFEDDGRRWGHILDPRTGQPAEGLLAAGISASAAKADALSTAFFVLGKEGAQQLCASRPNMGAVCVAEGAQGGEPQISTFGMAERIVRFASEVKPDE